jgi:aldose sugar dehydrogenase
MVRELQLLISMYRTLLVCFSAMALLVSETRSQDVQYSTRQVVGGLNVPWEIRWGYDDWIWFTERPGRISRVNPETGERKILLNAATTLQWHEAGMMGFDFHPDFPDSPYIYVAYTHEETWPAKLQLFRYTFSEDTLIDRQFILGDMRANFVHVGCRVRIHDRKLYMSVGEIDNGQLAQDLTSRHGKILRINLDGTIPEDNPFSDSPIWSYGHRNPQGLTFGPTGILYSSEHGTSTDDELNIIEPGVNYGWPVVEGFCDKPGEEVICDSLTIRQPLHSWIPTLGVSGTEFYNGEAFPEWKNSVVVAALRDQTLNRFTLDSSGRRVLELRRRNIISTTSGESHGRLRDLCFSTSGRVFVSTSNASGTEDGEDMIFEVVRTGVIPYSLELFSPVNHASVQEDSVYLMWRSSAGDSRYVIQLSNSPDFSEGTVEYQLNDTSLVIKGLSRATSYYWRAKEITSQGAWTDFREFSTTPSSVEKTELPRISLLLELQENGLIATLNEPLISSGFITLVDNNGRAVVDQYCSAGESRFFLSIHDLASGIYMCRLMAGNVVASKSIFIK